MCFEVAVIGILTESGCQYESSLYTVLIDDIFSAFFTVCPAKTGDNDDQLKEKISVIERENDDIL